MQVIQSAAHVTQNPLRKPDASMLQNATLLRKSAPWPPNISDEHVSCTAPATRNPSLQILFKCPTPAIVCANATKPSHFAHSWQGAEPLAPTTQNHASTSKSGANMWCFWHSDSKCASRHNGVHFFNIPTSKSGPRPSVLNTFGFEMRFAPKRRPLFRHLLRNVLRATTACNFGSLIWPDGSAPAALASLLFDPPGQQIIRKTQWIATFYLFACLHRLSSDSFSSLIFFLLFFDSSDLLFHLSILLEVWLLNFLRWCRPSRLSRTRSTAWYCMHHRLHDARHTTAGLG